MNRRPDENDDANASKRWKSEDWKPSEYLLHGRGTRRPMNFLGVNPDTASRTLTNNGVNPDIASRTLTNNGVNPATVSRTTTNNGVNPATVSRTTTNNAITPANARPSTTMPLKFCQVYQEQYQSILDKFMADQKAKRNDFKGLLESALDKKQRLEDDAKKDSIIINLICPEIGSYVESLLEQFDTLSIQYRDTKSNLSKTVILNQELKSQLSAQSKKMTDTCNNFNWQLAKHRDNAIQANKVRDETQSKLNDVEMERDEAKKERDEAINKHAKLTSQLNMALQVQEELEDEKEEAAIRATEVHGEMKRKDFVIGQLKTHISNLTSDKKNLERQLSKSKVELEQAYEHQSEEQDAKNQLISVVEGEREMAKKELHAALSKISTLSTECDSLMSDKESLIHQLSTATEQLDAALSKISTLSTVAEDERNKIMNVLQQRESQERICVKRLNVTRMN